MDGPWRLTHHKKTNSVPYDWTELSCGAQNDLQRLVTEPKNSRGWRGGFTPDPYDPAYHAVNTGEMNLEKYSPHLSALSLPGNPPTPPPLCQGKYITGLLKPASFRTSIHSSGLQFPNLSLFPPPVISLCLVTGERTWGWQSVISKLFLADWITEQQLAITVPKIRIKFTVPILWNHESHSLCKLNTESHVACHQAVLPHLLACVWGEGWGVSTYTSFITFKCWYAWLTAGQEGTIPHSREQAPVTDNTLPRMPGGYPKPQAQPPHNEDFKSALSSFSTQPYPTKK